MGSCICPSLYWGAVTGFSLISGGERQRIRAAPAARPRIFIALTGDALNGSDAIPILM